MHGEVIIQTYNPENFCIEHAKNQDYEKFYDTEIAIRKQLNYPPFCDIMLFSISSNDENELKKSANKIYDILEKNSRNINDINIYKPVSSPIGKIKNRYRWRIIVKCKLNNNIINLVNETLEEYYKLKYKNVKVIVDINPNNMM